MCFNAAYFYMKVLINIIQKQITPSYLNQMKICTTFNIIYVKTGSFESGKIIYIWKQSLHPTNIHST